MGAHDIGRCASSVTSNGSRILDPHFATRSGGLVAGLLVRIEQPGLRDPQGVRAKPATPAIKPHQNQ